MEEISLRELIEALLKRKIMIVMIMGIAVLAAVVINFAVLEPVYEAKAMLMASGINTKTQVQKEVKGVDELLDSLSEYPKMSIEAYKEQIKNPQILDQTIKELKLEEKGINRVSLRNMIALNTIKDTNLITIAIKNKDKALAADIANTVAKKFTVLISEIAKSQADKSSNYIKNQMEIEKSKLDEAQLEYKNYLSQPQGLAELKKEVESKTDLITQYKAELLNVEIEEKKLSASMEALDRELKKTPEKILLEKSIVDDTLMSHYASEKNTGNIDDIMGLKLESEEINGIYYALKNSYNDYYVKLSEARAKKAALNSAIAETRMELEELQAALAEKQYQNDIVRQKVDFTKSTYEAFLNKYEETRIIKSSDIGEASIIVVSPAVEPLTPIGPRKMFNIAVSGVIGLMLGIFISLFLEYWETSGINKV